METEILNKVIFDDGYREALKLVIVNSAMNLEDAIHWVDQSIIVSKISDIKAGEYLSYIMDMANKGYSQLAIATNLTPILNEMAGINFNKTL